MNKSPFLIIALTCIIGILFDSYYSFDLTINLSILLFLFVLFFTFLFYNLKFKSYILLVLLIFSFKLINFISNPFNNKINISNIYLKGDFIKAYINNSQKNKNGFYKCELTCVSVLRNKDEIFTNGKILLFVKTNSWKNYKPLIVFNSELNIIKNKNNPGEFNASFYWKNKGIKLVGFADSSNYKEIGFVPKNIFDYFTDLQNYFSNIIDKFISGNESSVAKALILGNRSSLDSETTAKFGNTGVMHILAVSGLHVGILMEILMLFFGFFKKKISKKYAIIVTLIVVWLYALLTGFSPSVVRSVIMFSVLSGATLFSKANQNINSLSFACIIILLWNPAFLFDIGFQLSFLAMLGIFLFYKDLSGILTFKNKFIKKIWETTMVGIAAQLFTVPLTLYYFHQFPNYFAISNIALMFSSFWILALGIALFSFFYIPFLSKVIAFLLWINLFVMIYIVSFIDSLPGAVAYGFTINQIIVLILFVSAVLFYLYLKYLNFKTLLFSLGLSFICIVYLVFIRFNNLYDNHVCFFNENQLVFAVKINNKSFIFYNKEKDFKKIKFLAENYRKINGSDLKFVSLDNKKKTFLSSKNNKILINRIKGGYKIAVNSNKYFYHTKNFNCKNNYSNIYAPWLKTEFNSLRYGAIISSF